MSSTSWPSTGLSPEVKRLITHFFSLVDLPKTDAGLKLAAEVFTEDGVFAATSGHFEGKAEIEKCRQNAWTTVRVRHHNVQKVYLNDADGVELIIMGVVTVERTEKAPETHDFVASAEVVDTEFEGPKIKNYHVLVPSSKKH